MGKPKNIPPIRRIDLSSRDYLHGELLAAGKRQVLAVRTEEGAWTWFPYQDCRQIMLGFKRPDATKAEVYRELVAYLQNGTLPKPPAWVSPKVSLEEDELVVNCLRQIAELST
jgi:hypothetical protein